MSQQETVTASLPKATDELVYDFEINGKAVHLKRRVPLHEGHRLMALLQACGSNDLDDLVNLMAVMIESWDFPGEPSDPKSYAALDVFDEVLPLSVHVVANVQQRSSRVSSKN